MQLNCGQVQLDLSRPVVMGVINTTPDSFSDGGRHLDPGVAVDAAHQMVAEGAAVIDIGGESTRPGATAVDLKEERQRVMPVIQRLTRELTVPISLDTSKPELMLEAAAAGAGMINDVYALRVPGALAAAAETGLPVCLMHMLGEPRTMQQSPIYTDVVKDVLSFLQQRVAECRRAGIESGRLLVDPGFGFGKTLAHNMALLGRLADFKALGLPLMVGLSRKSMIAAITGEGDSDRTIASVALALLAAERGARILRVHDVGPTVAALEMLEALSLA